MGLEPPNLAPPPAVMEALLTVPGGTHASLVPEVLRGPFRSR